MTAWGRSGETCAGWTVGEVDSSAHRHRHSVVRRNDDLDIALPHAQVPRLRALLSTRGFGEQRRDDSWECNFVLADEAGRRLDVHSYTLDAAGLNVGGVPYIGEQ